MAATPSPTGTGAASGAIAGANIVTVGGSIDPSLAGLTTDSTAMANGGPGAAVNTITVGPSAGDSVFQDLVPGTPQNIASEGSGTAAQTAAAISGANGGASSLGSTASAIGGISPYSDTKTGASTTPKTTTVAALKKAAAPTAATPAASSTGDKVSAFAQAQEGKPYVYDKAGPDSFDCSGLTLAAWAQVGTKLPHNANQQYQALPKVPIAQAQVGDLVFFPGSDGTSSHPGHVGIVIDPVKHLMVSAATSEDGGNRAKDIPVENYMNEKGVYATVGRPVAGASYT